MMVRQPRPPHLSAPRRLNHKISIVLINTLPSSSWTAFVLFAWSPHFPIPTQKSQLGTLLKALGFLLKMGSLSKIMWIACGRCCFNLRVDAIILRQMILEDKPELVKGGTTSEINVPTAPHRFVHHIFTIESQVGWVRQPVTCLHSLHNLLHTHICRGRRFDMHSKIDLRQRVGLRRVTS